MQLSKSTYKFYIPAGLLLAAGWLWILVSIYLIPQGGFTPCIIKNVTGLPCPACGSTSSVLSIFQLEWYHAFLINPAGYLIAIGLVVLPVWMICDAIMQKDSLLKTYIKFEQLVKRQPLLLGSLLFIIAINWIWNLSK